MLELFYSLAMASSTSWGKYCETAGVEHKLFAQYTHCPVCNRSNPNAANLPRNIREQSVIAERATAPADSNTNAAPISNVPAHVSFSDRSRPAESNRQQTFKFNRPPIPNAGSRAITAQPPSQSRRKAAVSQPKTPPVIRHKLTIQISCQILRIIEKGSNWQWLYEAPGMHDCWVDTITQSDFEAAAYSLSDWCFKQCENDHIVRDLLESDKHIYHGFVSDFNPEQKGYLPRIKLPKNEPKIVEVLKCFDNSKKQGYQLFLNVLHARDKKTIERYQAHESTASRSANFRPESAALAKDQSTSRELSLPIRSPEPAAASTTASQGDEEVYQSTELDSDTLPIKQEKPSWIERVRSLRWLLHNLEVL